GLAAPFHAFQPPALPGPQTSPAHADRTPGPPAHNRAPLQETNPPAALSTPLPEVVEEGTIEINLPSGRSHQRPTPSDAEANQLALPAALDSWPLEDRLINPAHEQRQ